MNYMKQVAEMLGVELNEGFKVEGEDGKFQITNDALFELINKSARAARDDILIRLIIGTAKIVKLPWKPKYKEKYYHMTCGGWAEVDMWRDAAVDVALYAFGNCFRTREEAEKHEEEMLQKMKEVMGE